MMHALADQHLNRLQIDMAGFALVVKDLPQQAFYFAGDFLADRIGRFFSCSDGVLASVGRI